MSGNLPSDMTAPRKGRFLRLLLRSAAFGCAAAAVVALVGLLSFVSEIVASRAPEEANGEGIVVLTGGRDRVDVAVDMLSAARSRRLLISGVNPTTTAVAIRRMTDAPVDLFQCCVDLGRQATTTRGNARETADWVELHRFRSLAVVTSAYHVPRALLEMRGEFRRRGMDVDLVAVGVRKDSLGTTASALDAETLRLLLAEYVKYMLAEGRLVAEAAGLTVPN